MFLLYKINVIKKIFFLLTIISFSLFNHYLSKYLQSFDPDFSEISLKLVENFNSSNPLKEYDSLSPELININTDTISADQDHSIKLKLPYKTGDLGTDIMELLYVKKSGKLFSIKNYNVTYFLNEKNVIHTIYPNMFPDDIEDTIENDVDCNYTILDNKYKLELQKINLNFSKIISYSYITLGIDKENNNIKKIEYNNKNIYENDIIYNILKGKEYFNHTNTINNSITFLDMFKIEQMLCNQSFFVFLVKHKNISTNSKNKTQNILLLFYEINLLIGEDFKLNLESVINITKILYNKELKTFAIQKIGYYQNYKFILFNNILIIYDTLNNKLIPFEQIFDINSININNINISDFLLYNKTFCLLSEDKGLIIFDIKEEINNNNNIKLYFNNNLEFNSGQKLEIYRNPFYGGIFLGIVFNTNKERTTNEIYMEIILENTKNNNTDNNTDKKIEIKINKVITASNTRNFLYLHLNNDFFKYFYDDFNKELFIYRNGLLNIVPYVTYKINLTEEGNNIELFNKEKIRDLIQIFNKKEEKFNLVFIGNNNYFILKNLSLASHNLNCTFHDIGSYNLTFILKGEVCANSLRKAEEGKFVTCHKIIKYNFHVYRRDKEKKIALFIIILFIVVLSASILFICYTINTGCFGKYKSNKSNKFKKILFSSRLDSEANIKMYSPNKQKEN